jgi:hypothetical protein
LTFNRACVKLFQMSNRLTEALRLEARAALSETGFEGLEVPKCHLQEILNSPDVQLVYVLRQHRGADLVLRNERSRLSAYRSTAALIYEERIEKAAEQVAAANRQCRQAERDVERSSRTLDDMRARATSAERKLDEKWRPPLPEGWVPISGAIRSTDASGRDLDLRVTSSGALVARTLNGDLRPLAPFDPPIDAVGYLCGVELAELRVQLVKATADAEAARSRADEACENSKELEQREREAQAKIDELDQRISALEDERKQGVERERLSTRLERLHQRVQERLALAGRDYGDPLRPEIIIGHDGHGFIVEVLGHRGRGDSIAAATDALLSPTNQLEPPALIDHKNPPPPLADLMALFSGPFFKKPPAPIPLLLHCPLCRHRHIDEGEFATRPHHTHACQRCGHEWRPSLEPTVGVLFLPGHENEPHRVRERTPAPLGYRWLTQDEWRGRSDLLCGLQSLASFPPPPEAFGPAYFAYYRVGGLVFSGGDRVPLPIQDCARAELVRIMAEPPPRCTVEALGPEYPAGAHASINEIGERLEHPSRTAALLSLWGLPMGEPVP